jgi:phospholipase C
MAAMTNRRNSLRNALSATVASTTLGLPPVIRKALAISAHQRTRTIADVEHVVILMQENRSFDPTLSAGTRLHNGRRTA